MCAVAALALGVFGAAIVVTGPAEHPVETVAGLVAASVFVVLTSQLWHRSSAQEAHTVPVSPFLATHGALPTLTTAEICAAWSHSTDVLARLQVSGTVQAQARVVSTRRQYLDELERRDPSGFAGWLRLGARCAGDPTPYLLFRMGHKINPIRASTALVWGALRGRGPPADGPSHDRDQ